MYCAFNATTTYETNTANSLGWPLEEDYGYFCDKRDKDLFFLSGGVLKMASVVGSYLIFLVWLGPKFMKGKEPLDFKNLMRMHNLAVILMEFYLIGQGLPTIEYGRNYFNCNVVELAIGKPEDIAYLTELFLISRLALCLDTLFFVLRKKGAQLSFLHVFHHSYVPIAYYLVTRFERITPNTMLFPGINALVHCIMYSYYFLSTYPALRKYLWWKRVCGKFQMPAFYASTISSAAFYILFSKFYKQAYETQPMKKEIKQL